VRARSEYIGAADEVAGKPVGERDLAPRRRRIVAAYASLADQVDPSLCVAMRPNQLAGFQGLLASDRAQPIAISPVETIQQAGQRSDEIVRLGQHHACRYRAIRP